LIVLISSLSDLNRFGIKVNQKGQRVLKKIWPGKISILLPCPQKRYQYLHRGTGYLAFRLPQKTWLRRLIKKTGPLVAPSANPEGLAPAQTAGEARKYFGQKISFYFSRGRLAGPPSTLAVLEPDGALKIIRPGAVKLNRKIKTTP
jgi:L-threonylcarbamoyladenylate synthase